MFIGIQATPTGNPLTIVKDVRAHAAATSSARCRRRCTMKVAYDSTEIHPILDQRGRAHADRGGVDRRRRDLPVPGLAALGGDPGRDDPAVAGRRLRMMLALGFSLNLLTLLAMVLAIGLVVDDAIVVVENIYRHIEEGLTPVQAALVGAREIVGPIIAMTITLAAVYAPDRLAGRPDRHAVPRIRLHAGGLGDHLRHHRADAFADDVLDAAEARGARGRFARFVDRSLLARSPTATAGGSTAHWIIALVTALFRA